MKRIVTSVAGVAVAVVACGGLMAGLGSVQAATPPPWEPDASSVGGLTFYNAAGVRITGGSTSDSPLAAYVEGRSTVRSGDNVATLFGYLPVKGQQPGQWSGEPLSGSTTYPNAGAPTPLTAATLPVASGADGDLTVADLASDFPNLDATSDGYAHVYELRLVTSKPQEGVSPKYDSADIEITGSTWSVLYSRAPNVATTTKLTVSPSKQAFHGATTKLSATVTPSAATGRIEFLDGAKVLKTVTLAAGKASLSTKTLPNGIDKLKARYLPSRLNGYSASSSIVRSLTVKPHATRVSVKASNSAIKVGATLTLSIKEAPVVAGSVTIYDGSTKIGKVKVKRGRATFASHSLKLGTHQLKAKFTPSKPQNDAVSTSKTVTVKVTK
jgi:hypothetical protein